ncbi:IS21 family transposase [Singulisphaera acidiphila]|uniref:Transposase n=1 Tax=Singulisphaera acidiphila (strain ATCC BAA-1392 / DSM 18658 / VKM B-2454 / MOB10) TaxID=886293 RepID=L0DCZ6_SINAD|nr:IS21 family transposase [Singulisphaera acidiphila]AGA26521.1 transposase [Singulisphaera acidiphila DSM 18658]
MFTHMHNWAEIRRRVLVDRQRKRSICREFDIHWDTLQKILLHDEPPGYRQARPRARPKLEPFLPILHQILQDDRKAPRKQRHTVRRLFPRLRDEYGYRGGLTMVQGVVQAWREGQAEAFLPLIHRPGDAQADFGRAVVDIAGHSSTAALFVMTLTHSDAIFCAVFPRECTLTFQEGHRLAFACFGGVPRRITYDNTRIAVARIIGQRGEGVTTEFLRLKSHYLFESHFCRVRSPNEKGHVESLLGYARRNFLVPVPEADSFATLNARLQQSCRGDLGRTTRGQSLTNGQLLERERGELLNLPEEPLSIRQVEAVRANSLSLVRFDRNDYSVPTRYAHRRLTVVADVERVRMETAGTIVADHTRCWDRCRTIFDPVHYLGLLERKPGALDFALPLEGWELPACFAALRRRLAEDHGPRGQIEYIRVLERATLEELTAAVEQALRLEISAVDGVRLILEHRRDRPTAPLDLEGRPHLPRVSVPPPDLSGYRSLCGEAQP